MSSGNYEGRGDFLGVLWVWYDLLPVHSSPHLPVLKLKGGGGEVNAYPSSNGEPLTGKDHVCHTPALLIAYQD